MSDMEGRRISRKPIPEAATLEVEPEPAVGTAPGGEAEREAERAQARRQMTTLSNVSESNEGPIDASNTEQPQQPRRGFRSFFRRRRQVEEAPIIDEKKSASDAENAPADLAPGELLDLETHWPLITDHAMRELSVDFHPPTQLIRLLVHGLRRWLLTGILIGAMIGVIYNYSTYAVMTEQDKNTYNFLTIGLSLALGMAIASSLKAMAVNFRWWVLSLRKKTPREVDLILHIDSLTECVRLAFHSPRLSFACLLWLILNIGIQVAVAAIGLTYSPENRSSFGKAVPGNVTIANMTQVFTEVFVNGATQSLFDQQYTANSYGQISLAYNYTTVDKLPDPLTLWTSADRSTTVFYDPNLTFWQYNFLDTNPVGDLEDPSDTSITVYTNRNVNVTWQCQSWTVIKGGNGDEFEIQLLINSNGVTKNISLPVAGGLDQTTFITLDNKTQCGPVGSGCYSVSAFEASLTKPYYYTCNMTVGTVGNATHPEHQIGENIRELAAEGIALQGFSYTRDDPNDVRQYQSYPAASIFGEIQSGNADDMGALIGRFAIGVIAAAANYNPTLEVPGQLPSKGSALTVKWNQLIAILATLGGLQALLVILTSFVANLVVVKDDSPLAIARTLRPLVSRLGPAGSMAGGEEIAKAIGDTKVVYSVRHPQIGNMHHLDLGVQKRLRAFPRGDYD